MLATVRCVPEPERHASFRDGGFDETSSGVRPRVVSPALVASRKWRKSDGHSKLAACGTSEDRPASMARHRIRTGRVTAQFVSPTFWHPTPNALFGQLLVLSG